MSMDGLIRWPRACSYTRSFSYRNTRSLLYAANGRNNYLTRSAQKLSNLATMTAINTTMVMMADATATASAELSWMCMVIPDPSDSQAKFPTSEFQTQFDNCCTSATSYSSFEIVDGVDTASCHFPTLPRSTAADEVNSFTRCYSSAASLSGNFQCLSSENDRCEGVHGIRKTCTSAATMLGPKLLPRAS